MNEEPQEAKTQEEPMGFKVTEKELDLALEKILDGWGLHGINPF